MPSYIFDRSTVKDVNAHEYNRCRVVSGLLGLSQNRNKTTLQNWERSWVWTTAVVVHRGGRIEANHGSGESEAFKDHFALAAHDIGIPEATMGALIRFMLIIARWSRILIKSTAQTRPGSTPYQDLDWRLDVEVARRRTMHSIEPSL